MLEQALATVEALGLAQVLRQSVWLYPAANVLHIIGLMAFFAAVAAMDVKALAGDSNKEVHNFISRVRPFAVTFLVVQFVSGAMLFLPEASHISHNLAFRLKLASILLALLNVIALETALSRAHQSRNPPVAVRVLATLSIMLWVSVAALGRLIAYF